MLAVLSFLCPCCGQATPLALVALPITWLLPFLELT